MELQQRPDKNLLEQAKKDLHELIHMTPEARKGKVGYALAWMLGVPLPILLIVYMVRSC